MGDDIFMYAVKSTHREWIDKHISIVNHLVNNVKTKKLLETQHIFNIYSSQNDRHGMW